MKLIEKVVARFKREEIYSTSEYWDKKAESYRDIRASMWRNRDLDDLYHRWQLHFLDCLLPDVSGRAILEIGCGTGRIALTLAKKGAHVTGMDFSVKALNIAKEAAVGEWPKWRYGSVFTLSDAGCYDAIVSIACLAVACRTRDQLLDAVRRCWDALVPDGKLVLIEPFHRGFLHRVLNLSAKEAVTLLEHNGFVIDYVSSMAFWPARLLLAELCLPRWLTKGVASCGEWVLAKVFNRRHFGDYSVIRAIKATMTQVQEGCKP
jgi:2-polyprenyl-3-methyl-5-hydroxy-6-metoxy-1,4-benzoquinol methylase